MLHEMHLLHTERRHTNFINAEVAKWILNQCATRNSDGDEIDGAEQGAW